MSIDKTHNNRSINPQTRQTEQPSLIKAALNAAWQALSLQDSSPEAKIDRKIQALRPKEPSDKETKEKLELFETCAIDDGLLAKDKQGEIYIPMKSLKNYKIVE